MIRYNFYEEIAPYYCYITQDLKPSGHEEFILNAVLKFKNKTDFLSCLDLGCSRGMLMIKFATNLNCNCVGIDLMKPQIDFANDILKKNNIKNCIFIADNYNNVLKNLNKFDIVSFGNPADFFNLENQIKTHVNDDFLFIVKQHSSEGNEEFENTCLNRNYFIKYKEIFEENPFYWFDTNANFFLKKRLDELCSQFPEKIKIFNGFMELMKKYTESTKYKKRMFYILGDR